jgi:hypothetical protein
MNFASISSLDFPYSEIGFGTVLFEINSSSYPPKIDPADEIKLSEFNLSPEVAQDILLPTFKDKIVTAKDYIYLVLQDFLEYFFLEYIFLEHIFL